MTNVQTPQDCSDLYSTSTHKIDTELNKAGTKMILIISASVLTIGYHLATWGSHSLEIRYLQIRDFFGMSSVSSMEKMVAICSELKMHDCVEQAHYRIAQLDRSRITSLAEYLVSRHKIQDAEKILATYLAKIKQPHKDPNAVLAYAKVLSEAGKIDHAIPYFEKALTLFPKNNQPEILKNYVQGLARNKRYTKAQSVILNARRSQSANFMEQEYRLLGAVTPERNTASR